MLSDRRLAALDLLADVATADTAAQFGAIAVGALLRLVPGDTSAYCEFAPHRARHVVMAVNADPGAGAYDSLRTHQPHDPWIRHVRRTGTSVAARWSDFVDRTELDRNEMYQQLYRPLGIRHLLSTGLHAGDDELVTVCVGRIGRDFTDDERVLFEQLRPRLARVLQAVGRRDRAAAEAPPGLTIDVRATEGAVQRRRHAEPVGEGARAAQLTARQSEVVELISLGMTNDQIARRLGISPRTVRKHLSTAFVALGTDNRVSTALRWAHRQTP
jgi:DNA-binding CsgD family transcriptional regulator